MTTPSGRDGRTDFDFLFGSWKVHNRRLKGRLCGSTEWEEFPSVCRARPVMGGLGNIDELVVEMPAGQVTAVTVPRSARFEGRRGEFYSQELFEGRHIFNRFIWSVASPAVCHWEQAFSADGGRNWETNWTMEFTRQG